MDFETPAFSHRPIMVPEVMRLMDVRPGHVVVDCTAGGGGHLRAFAEHVGPAGKVLALDRDPRAHGADAAGGVAATYADRVRLFAAPFSQLAQTLKHAGVQQVDGVFADLGVSSHQLDDKSRGFSFQTDAPLDMRMDPTQGETACELIDRLDEDELADVIFQLGDERMSRRIARAIKRARPTSTGALAQVVSSAAGGRHGKIHPATRTFQALRMATNAELMELEQLLDALRHLVKPGGHAGFLSFHSLEDGRVKRCFKEEGFVAVTKRPVTPGEQEQRDNPRSRSAKLRVAVLGTRTKKQKYAQRAHDDHGDVDAEPQGLSPLAAQDVLT